jgi:hypothetical protein
MPYKKSNILPSLTSKESWPKGAKFKIPNKKTIAHAAQAPALRVEPVLNL